MKAFGLAFTLWGGTIMLCCTFLFLEGIFTMNFLFVGASIIGFFAAIFISSPLLLPTTLLIKLASRIPYGATVRLYWLSFTLLLQNYLFFMLLDFADNFSIAGGEYYSLYFISAVALVFMLIFRRTAIKIFFSQTTNKES
jgi:hypothetical protein